MSKTNKKKKITPRNLLAKSLRETDSPFKMKVVGDKKRKVAKKTSAELIQEYYRARDGVDQ